MARREIVLPDGKKIRSRAPIHIDMVVDGAFKGIRVYRHEDGYDCTHLGEPIRLKGMGFNWPALERALAREHGPFLDERA